MATEASAPPPPPLTIELEDRPCQRGSEALFPPASSAPGGAEGDGGAFPAEACPASREGLPKPGSAPAGATSRQLAKPLSRHLGCESAGNEGVKAEAFMVAGAGAGRAGREAPGLPEAQTPPLAPA